MQDGLRVKVIQIHKYTHYGHNTWSQTLLLKGAQSSIHSQDPKNQAPPLPPPPLPLITWTLKLNQIVFNWTHGVWLSGLGRGSTPLVCLHLGCLLQCSSPFALSALVTVCSVISLAMRRHCLSVGNGTDFSHSSDCVYPACRYACHKKCCLKTTTKCSKKVSRPCCPQHTHTHTHTSF